VDQRSSSPAVTGGKGVDGLELSMSDCGLCHCGQRVVVAEGNKVL
jgi:hypothetical protein